MAISRDGIDRVRTLGRDTAPFLIRLADGSELTARAVIDASGTWPTPNVLGASGLPAHGEADAAAFIDAALPDVLGADRDRYAGRHTLVVGAGHSAANTLLALAQLADEEPGTTVELGDPHRNPGPHLRRRRSRRPPGPRRARLPGARPGRQSDAITLHPGFSVARIDTTGDTVTVTARNGQTVTVDRIVSATGFRPDHTIAAELRLDLDPIMGSTRALAPLIDPNEHSCGTVPPHGVDELAHPEPGYYAIGAKSYGRAPTFLMATGYEQARSVVAALAGDWDAARDVATRPARNRRLLLDQRARRSGRRQLLRHTTAAACPVGLATGITGGLLSLPILETAPAATGGCCAG